MNVFLSLFNYDIDITQPCSVFKSNWYLSPKLNSPLAKQTPVHPAMELLMSLDQTFCEYAK
jgi:hypothetical protein